MKVERVRKPECNRNTVSGRDRHIISAALCCSCISDKQNCFAADLCSVSVSLIEKSYSLTTRHSIKVMGKTRWHEHSKQKDTQKRKEKEEGTDREEENHKHYHRQQNKPHWGPCAISNPAVCVNSWCITSLLRLEVIVLYVSFLDLAQNTQIKLRHQLKRSAGREKKWTESRNNHTDNNSPFPQFHFNKNRPASSQNVWNFPLEYGEYREGFFVFFYVCIFVLTLINR